MTTISFEEFLLAKPMANFALFSAACAGLFRAFLRRGAPTADYAARALGLPVLASPGFKPLRA